MVVGGEYLTSLVRQVKAASHSEENMSYHTGLGNRHFVEKQSQAWAEISSCRARASGSVSAGDSPHVLGIDFRFSGIVDTRFDRTEKEFRLPLLSSQSTLHALVIVMYLVSFTESVRVLRLPRQGRRDAKEAASGHSLSLPLK